MGERKEPVGRLELPHHSAAQRSPKSCHPQTRKYRKRDAAEKVPEKRRRRKFTAKYKLRILAEAEACNKPGQIGALLRREGLYSSNLSTWTRQKEAGLLKALSPKKRGRKGKEKNPLAQQVARLERENERLKQQLRKAEIIIDVQKKISQVLGISQNLSEEEENDS